MKKKIFLTSCKVNYMSTTHSYYPFHRIIAITINTKEQTHLAVAWYHRHVLMDMRTTDCSIYTRNCAKYVR